jgi:hypothetical protein
MMGGVVALAQPVLTVTVMTAGLSIFVKLPAQKTHPTSYSPVMLAADLALAGQRVFTSLPSIIARMK